MNILINNPGDGEWIMQQAGGSFRPGFDHSLATHRDGVLLGGFVFSGYMGNLMSVHMAGRDPRWCTRELLWMIFDYAFRQIGVQKLVGPVASNNTVALELDKRAGYTEEAVIKDAIAPGVDLVLLTMSRENCRWLKLRPQHYRSGGTVG